MENYTKQTFKIFLKHSRRYKISIFLIIISVIIASFLGRVTPLFYKKFFDLVAQNTDLESLFQILIQILIINGVSWLFWRIGSFINIHFESNVMANLANTCFQYLHKHSVNFFNNNFVGSLVKKVNRFSRAFEAITDIFIWEFLPILADIIFITVVLFFKNKYFGFFILLWIIFYISISYFFSLYKLKYDFQKSELNSKVTGVLADSITNHFNIKLFNGYQRESKRFSEINYKLKKIRTFTWILGNIFDSFQGILMIGLEFTMLYFAIKLWKKQIFTVGDLVLIQTYLITIFYKLWGFGRIIRRYYEHMADAEEMTEILQTPHKIKDIKNAKKLIVKNASIKFKNVSFYYHQTRNILNNFNLNINPQEKIALVGHSGSGKSTIVNLLLRIFDIDQGKILIDNQDIQQVTQESLWQNISYVPQDSILFHRSLIENVKYGNPQAKHEEVMKAIKSANCHQFIENFPEKYKTYVGERGVKLSGGERQRIAIARAILKNAPILILDEATSSLDSESEQLIQEALDTLMKKKTVIVIAHRLSTIMKMDKIIVLEKGKIKEQGNHQELIKIPNGLYKKLWEKQVCNFT